MRVRLLFILLLMASVVSSLWVDAALPNKVTPTEPIILVVGDSLSAGYGMDVKQGWVTLLEQRLSAQGYGYRVVNASVSGETSGGARGRLTKLLETRPPAIMILEIGANDGLRGLPIKQTEDNITVMVAQAKMAGARVLIIGMQMPPNYGARYTEEFAAVFRNVADKQQQPLVPFLLDGVALDMNLIQADGLHPTAAAQPRLLDNVWMVLRPMLKKAMPKKK
jgi:acyl-CoA thioesterase-1